MSRRRVVRAAKRPAAPVRSLHNAPTDRSNGGHFERLGGREGWEQAGSRSMTEAALERTRQILSDEAHILIDEDTDREVGAIEERFLRELAEWQTADGRGRRCCFSAARPLGHTTLLLEESQAF